MTRHSLAATALVAFTTLASLLTGLPAQAASPADGSSSERVAPIPRAISLVGRDLHLSGGTVMRLPRAAGATPVLLGTVGNGWIVASGGSFRLVRPDGGVRGIAGRNRTELYVTEALSDDGNRILSASTDQADALYLRVVDLRGRELLDTWYQSLFGEISDVADGRVYVVGFSGTRAIDDRDGTVTRVVQRPTALVAAEHDVVFVGTRKRPGLVGPTSLSGPGTPAWRARFDPVAVSPDGRYVVGREGTVRSMRDGRVVRRVPVPKPRADEAFRFLGWGATGRVLIERSVGQRRLLTSCAVPRGACRQVGSTTGYVSLPTSHAGPYLQPS
ncbi:hypothetical protein [Nocardioides sp. cx-173]|uniref:hypothetical protein n=1 Tax=Nocardioides sp. cx-173 TaxID=2898796 RepID=UPI001E360FC1|nr:hypothetical protein [Nocardioides sp. cx-173]MCD4527004.1 hypothetical protein [Nocardioides sp. cx-173]UGB41061.1 hypothetical protein LQ940_17025 [Nocardioides sp. cx-173]